MARVAIIVPRRADGGWRDRLWGHCKALWRERFPEWSIFEGEHPGDDPFNRSRAINAGVALADGSDWEVLLIIDADTISDPRCVASAVRLAALSDQLVVAHDERIMLGRRATERILQGYIGPWRAGGMVETVYHDSVSCAVAVSRRLWELAGPFDEGFVGWGREDSGFGMACEVETGPIVKLAGEVFHLWHATAPEVGLRHPARLANEHRYEQYLKARWDRDAIRALRGADRPATGPPEAAPARPDRPPVSGSARLTAAPKTGSANVASLPGPAAVNSPPGASTETIPRILFRTVPPETTEEVEAWWAEFARFHPGWLLVTYRDPLDPAQWPETGALWARCANGAQKAGLIRLEALVRHGGIYVDSDVEPFRPFEPLRWAPAFAGWEDANVVPDAVLGSAPGHPAFRACLAEAVELVAGGSRDAWQTGPGVTTKLLPGRDDVLLLAPGAFYPMHYLDRSSRELVQDARAPWMFAMHHYTHSWGTPAQKRAITQRQRRPALLRS